MQSEQSCDEADAELPSQESEDSLSVREALEQLEAQITDANVQTEILNDDSNMTPMLSVDHRQTNNRAELFRCLFHPDGPVAVDGVYDHRIVVREQQD